MLRVMQVSKQYGKNGPFAVHPTSMVLMPGKRYTLVGESGSGKTTLVRMVCGLTKPDSGHVFLDGRDIFREKDKRNIYRRLQIVFQDALSSLNPQMTVYELIAEPLRRLLGMPETQTRSRVGQIMDDLRLPSVFSGKKPRELSGGQLKRVSIARAIGVKPHILVMDESLSGLDVLIQKDVIEIILEQQKQLECTLFVITHDMKVALYISDTSFVMKDGKIVEQVCHMGNCTRFENEYSRLLAKA